MTSVAIPTTLAEATDIRWLNRVLVSVYDTEIDSVEVTEVVKGVASKVRIGVRFSSNPATQQHFCIKAFLDIDEQSRQLGEVALREVEFYSQIAPQLSMRVPACPVAIADHESLSGIMIMEDLIAKGGSFCNALKPFSAATARDSLGQVARLHAASHVLQDNPWIESGLDWMTGSDLFPLSWLQGQMHDGRGSGLPDYVLDAQRLLKAVQAMTRHSESGVQTLLHGDCHIANVYTTPQGPGFADWQLIKRGNWAIDVAYHLNSTLHSDVAEQEERALVEHYRDAVLQHGGQPADSDTAWDDYCQALPYGFFLWAITVQVEKPVIYKNFQRLGKAIERNNVYERLGLL